MPTSPRFLPCAASALLALSFVLAACSTNNRAAAPTYRPASANRPPAAAPAPARAEFTGRSPEALLRLRAGLNVAALSCRARGRVPVAGAYGRVLSRHSSLLANAYASERQRLGVAGLDRQQTRLYNRFANQRSPTDFCRAAADIAGRAGSMDSASLAPGAARLASELEGRL